MNPPNCSKKVSKTELVAGNQLYVEAITVVGVALVTKSVVAPINEAKMIALPTAAGLKMLLPNPPNNNLPSTIQQAVAMINAYGVIEIGTIIVKIIDVTQPKDVLI